MEQFSLLCVEVVEDILSEIPQALVELFGVVK